MRWLRKLRGGDGGEASGSAVAKDVPVCEHIALVPRWGSTEDIGKDDRATGYTCEACRAEFTAAEAQSLRATEAARVKQRIAD